MEKSNSFYLLEDYRSLDVGQSYRFLDSSPKARERFRKAVGLVDGKSIPESARLEYEEWLK